MQIPILSKLGNFSFLGHFCACRRKLAARHQLLSSSLAISYRFRRSPSPVTACPALQSSSPVAARHGRRKKRKGFKICTLSFTFHFVSTVAHRRQISSPSREITFIFRSAPDPVSSSTLSYFQSL
ncbi:unnamed protein product [Rhodiola kirilowii]